MKTCVNYECCEFDELKDNNCRVIDDSELCECHNDDPDSKEVVEYKRKLTDTFLKSKAGRKKKNKEA